MQYRQLGRSDLKVSALSLGTMTFGGQGKFAKTGATDVNEARNQIAMCIDAGINLFDTADVYSADQSEEILDQALGTNATKCWSPARPVSPWVAARTTPGCHATT